MLVLQKLLVLIPVDPISSGFEHSTLSFGDFIILAHLKVFWKDIFDSIYQKTIPAAILSPNIKYLKFFSPFERAPEDPFDYEIEYDTLTGIQSDETSLRSLRKIVFVTGHHHESIQMVPGLVGIWKKNGIELINEE